MTGATIDRLLAGVEAITWQSVVMIAIGAWTGLSGILPTVLLSSLVGAIIGSIWLAAKGRDKATPIPFGPYLAVAGWIVFFWGDQMVDGYMRVAGLG